MASKKPRRASLQLRRDSAANWEANNPVLLDGEEVLVYTSTGAVRRKVGDGIAHYNELPYDDDRINAALAQKQNKLTGPAGQIVGFDSNGNASAQQVLADDVYFLDGDTVADKMDSVESLLGSTDIFIAGASAPSNTKLLWIDTNATTGGLKYYNGSAWVHVPVAYT